MPSRLKRGLWLFGAVCVLAALIWSWQAVAAFCLVVLGLAMGRAMMSALHSVPDRVLEWAMAETEEQRARREAETLNKELEASTAQSVTATKRKGQRL